MPKIVKRQSNLSTTREAPPTSPTQARHFMNFRFNHLTQRNTLPNVLGRGSASGADWGPCNTSGGPAGDAGVGQALGGGGMTRPRNEPGQTKV
jgi:hypothetical protein